MTEQLYFDTDCLSSFLWVRCENILLNLYHGRIILPQQVFNELSNPSIPHLQSKIAVLKENGEIGTQQILTGTEEYQLYYEMAISPPKGEMIIGAGEAAALALATVRGGIVASNNLRDIRKYLNRYQLRHITTGDILVASLDTGLMDEKIGNDIWKNMIAKRRFLPAASFSEYLQALPK